MKVVESNNIIINKRIKEIKEEIIKNLKLEQDYKNLKRTIKLIKLRDNEPIKCIIESNKLFNDVNVNKCWRLRAGLYRAESLMKLGYHDLAKDQLISTCDLLNSSAVLPVDLVDPNRYQILNSLVAWNIDLGILNWGMIDSTKEIS